MKKLFKLFFLILCLCNIAFANVTTEIYNKYESSIFRIIAGKGHGTGFLINKDGYIVTNAHVTALSFEANDDKGNSIEIELTGAEASSYFKEKERYYAVIQKVGEKSFVYKAKLIAERRDLDLAVLKVNNLEKAIPIPVSSKSINAGEDVFAIGYPGANDKANENFVNLLFGYLEIKTLSEEEIFKALFDELYKTLSNAQDKEILTSILQNGIRNPQEEEWVKQKGINKVIADFLTFAELRNAVLAFETTANCPEKKELPKDFLEVATPKIQSGKTESILVNSSNWGLDRNSNVQIIQHNAPIRSGNSGGPLLNQNGEVIGVVTAGYLTLEANLMLASFHKELTNFLDTEKINYSHEKLEIASFISDYFVMFLIIVVGIVLCLLLYFLVNQFLISRSTNIGNTLQFSTHIPNVSEAAQAEEVYVPKRLKSFPELSGLEVKFTSIEPLIKSIKSILNGEDSGASNVYKVAKEYKNIQNVAIKRLQQCVTLIAKGNKKEALEIAIAYPSVVEIINDLQFDRLGDWIDFCRRAGVSVPAKISNADIDLLNSILEEGRNKGNANAESLREFMAHGQLREAINLLEGERILNPNNTEIARQLLSLKNKYLDKLITEVSIHARNGEHLEALKIYEDIITIIPEFLRTKSPRWKKMQGYIDETTFSFASEDIDGLFEDLQITPENNWRRTYEIIDEINKIREKHPQLNANIDINYVTRRLELADEIKSIEVNKIAFKDMCSSLYAYISEAKEIMVSKKCTLSLLKEKLNNILEAHKKLKKFSLDIPEDLTSTVSLAKKSLEKGIRIRTFVKITSYCMLSVTILMGISFVSYTVYMHNRKVNAYNNYLMLKDEIIASAELIKKISSWESKYPKYTNLKEFKDVKSLLDNRIVEITSREKDLEVLKNDFEKYNLSQLVALERIDSVYELEQDLKKRYERIEKELPKLSLKELDISKANFTKFLDEYKTQVKENTFKSRKELLAELARSKNLSKHSPSEILYGDKILLSMSDSISLFEKSKNVYTPDFTAEEIEQISKYKEFIKKALELKSNIQKLEGELIGKDYEKYIKSVESLQTALKDNDFTNDTLDEEINNLISQKDEIDKKIKSIYKAESSFIREASSHIESSMKTNGFRSTVQNSNLILTIQSLCTESLQKIYRYRYECYNDNNARVSDLTKPVDSKTIYTLSPAVQERVLKKHSGRYRSLKIISVVDVTTKFYPVKMLYAQNTSESVLKVRNVKCQAAVGIVTYKEGDLLSDGELTRESDIIRKFYSSMYDENSGELRNSSLLDNIEMVMFTENVSDEFKFYFIAKILRTMDGFVPFESGLRFSPVLSTINSFLLKHNSEVFNILSDDYFWVKALENPTHITIINEFSRLLKSFKNKKHTIRYESALALNSVAQAISPKLDIIGYCGLDGKPKDTFIASTEESCRYLTISNDGSLKFSNKLEDIEGNPYSPIFRVYSLKDYINKNIKTLDGSKKYDIYEYINER